MCSNSIEKSHSYPGIISICARTIKRKERTECNINKLEDTKGVIRSRTFRKDREYNVRGLNSDYDNPNISVVVSIFLAVIVELIVILKLLKCLS